jgi:hypothetical protein
MSRLKLYWPDQDSSESNGTLSFSSEDSTSDEMIIPFRLKSFSNPAESHLALLDVVTRAQTLRENRECRQCGHPVVEPVELNDAAVNRNGLPIPGTATLVGFHCARCDREWPV